MYLLSQLTSAVKKDLAYKFVEGKLSEDDLARGIREALLLLNKLIVSGEAHRCALCEVESKLRLDRARDPVTCPVCYGVGWVETEHVNEEIIVPGNLRGTVDGFAGALIFDKKEYSVTVYDTVPGGFLVVTDRPLALRKSVTLKVKFPDGWTRFNGAVESTRTGLREGDPLGSPYYSVVAIH